MKKVTYLLAAFALATSATMTSCVDNNESAAVEQIRTAKAKQLEALASMQKAMGDAELVSANAAMVIAQAEAELKKAQAAVALAEAELKKTENEANRVSLEEAKLVLAEKQAIQELVIKKAVAIAEQAVLDSQKTLEQAIREFKQFQDSEINKYLENLLGLYSNAIMAYQGKCTGIVAKKNDLFEALYSTTGLEQLERIKAREINTQNRIIVAQEATIETLKSLPETPIKEAEIALAEAKASKLEADEVKKEADKMATSYGVAITEENEMLATDTYNGNMATLAANTVKGGVMVYTKINVGTNAPTWTETLNHDVAKQLDVPVYPAGTETVEQVTVTGKVISFEKTSEINIKKYTVDQQVLTYAKDQAGLYIADLKIDITALTKKYGENVAKEVEKRELLAKGAVTTDTKYAAFLSAEKANTDAQAALIAASKKHTDAIAENNRIQNDSAATQAQKDAAAAAVIAAQVGVNTAQADVTLKAAALTKAINEITSAGADIQQARIDFQTAVNATAGTLSDLNNANSKLATVESEKAKIEKYISLSTDTQFEDAYKAKCADAILLNEEYMNVKMKANLAEVNSNIYKDRVEVLEAYVMNALDIEVAIQACEDAIATAKYTRDNMADINTKADFVEQLNEQIANLEVEVVAYKAKADALKVKIDAEMAKK